MSQPNTTGQLGLDIAAFEAAWERAMTRLDTAGGRINNVNAGLNQSASAFSRIGKILAGGAILSFVHTLTTAGREANTLTKELDELDLSTHADKFGEAEMKARGFKDALLDITAAASKIPVIGSLVDIAMSPLKNAVEILKSARALKLLENSGEGNSGAMLNKFSELEHRRSESLKAVSDLKENPVTIKKFALLGVGDDRLTQVAALEKQIRQIEVDRLELARNISDATVREGKSRTEIIAGSREASQIEAAKAKAIERVAALRDSMANKETGDIRPEDQGLFDAQKARIKTELGVNVEGIKLAGKVTRDTQSAEVKTAATKMFGIRGELAASNIRVALAKEVYEVEKNTTAERRKAASVALVNATVDNLMKKQAFDDSERASKLQLIQSSATRLGLTQIANRAKLMAEYMPKIAQATREFGVNSIQAKAAVADYNTELVTQKVAEHDQTAGDKVRAARMAQRNKTKADQVDLRDRELQRRVDRGIKLAPRDAAMLAAHNAMRRQGPNLNKEAADRALVVNAVVQIANLMNGGK